ncbi:hypothetical protein DTO166G4_2495 [Paecilomyces variotii]|uniref:Mtf2-like C-terminal domain-containing protein n=1 Tax=Byssochlamys spectabilis TaxID=264951 RepID=A0A443HLQ5_BYSSP|nr:hypothetical protein C8Q69DRAFT_478261 [Paecilomyces variotii]KAJ9197921.1 hypothetical protein DTO164E3_5477 [Paecilomyces variotii]KAJ9215951.1 hypothetical protein DTO166G4_2495 [Paecilomyces variotii]KAJ9235977.1 hypothetical protein DTO166G5_4269 [Paecilomyces variotii]KAJ9351472.1 hypothetical protein DTO280E4_8200 [Paecilomyces variotii]RWQ92726.1 hypothetical protein C8Q69DRAFT_478261 [Paecilomyces variotii]
MPQRLMAANIGRSLTLFKAENPLLPFLYQTRTLTASQSHLYRKLIRPQRCRPYSTDNAPSDKPSDNGSQTAESPSPEQPAISSKFEEAPSKPQNYLKKRAIAATRSKSTAPPTRGRKNRSTMTRAEKDILDRLYGQFGTGLPSQPEEKEKEETLPVKEPRKMKNAEDKPKHLSASEKQELSEVTQIFEEAVNDAKARSEGAPGEQEQTGSEFEERKAHPMLERHIPNIDVELQRISTMFERIRRFKYSDVDLSDRARTITIDRVVELVVGIESEKIEAALRTAIDQGKGDLELWEVCEERVFGMLRHLDIYDGTEKNASDAQHNQPDDITILGPPEPSQSLSSDKAETKQHAGPLEIPPFVPVYPVVSALYPSMLFTALSLLKTHFPDSPLIGQFLPTVKSYGRTSVVLGASTRLYNELMEYYWRVYDDLPTVVSLLKEMDSTGVEPNLWTYSLVKKIIRTRADEKQAHRRRMREFGDDAVRKEEWFETEPNQRALRQLAGKKNKPGWLQHLKSRLFEVNERQRMENEENTTPPHTDFTAPVRKLPVD